MTKNDAIISVLTHCNKLRDEMIKKDVASNVGAYVFLQEVETLCLVELTKTTCNFENQKLVFEKKIETVIPSSVPAGTGDYVPPVCNMICGTLLDGAGRETPIQELK
jgi:hypothetical protein